MKEFRVLAAALCMLLVSLTVSGIRSVSATPESSTYDIYEKVNGWCVVLCDGPKEGKTGCTFGYAEGKGGSCHPFL